MYITERLSSQSSLHQLSSAFSLSHTQEFTRVRTLKTGSDFGSVVVIRPSGRLIKSHKPSHNGLRKNTFIYRTMYIRPTERLSSINSLEHSRETARTVTVNQTS